MNPVDYTKTKQLFIDFSCRSIKTDNIIFAVQDAQKPGYMASDEKPTEFRSTVASYLGFNWELMERMNYGS